MSGMKGAVKLLVSLAIPQAAGGIGSAYARAGLADWYPRLNKPAFTPPSWIFAPTWIMLYILMGISMFLVWRRGDHRTGVTSALSVFGIQLVLNGSWPYAFFGRQSTGAGLAVIAVLWVFILITMIRFLRVSRTAALLLIPYLAWVSFAAVLNYAIHVMNR